MLWGRCSVCLSVCNVDVLWPNGWMDQDATWYRGRPPPRRHRVRWGPSSPYVKGYSSPPLFGTSIAAKRSPISATAEHLFFCLHCVAWLHALRSSWFGQRDYNNWYRDDIDANDSALHRCRGNKCWWMTIELAARPKRKRCSLYTAFSIFRLWMLSVSRAFEKRRSKQFPYTVIHKSKHYMIIFISPMFGSSRRNNDKPLN